MLISHFSLHSIEISIIELTLIIMVRGGGKFSHVTISLFYTALIMTNTLSPIKNKNKNKKTWLNLPPPLTHNNEVFSILPNMIRVNSNTSNKKKI